MHHPRLANALRTVVDSCRVARRVQSRLDEVRKITKDDRSPVTVADFAVQAVVALDLRAAEAGTPIVGEERADVLRQPEQAAVRDAVVDAVRESRPDATADEVLDAIDGCDHDATGDGYWTLDPVDGTKGFLRGQQYAIALAWIERGRVALGALGCPNLPLDHGRSLETADATGSIYAAVAGGGAWEIDPRDPDGAPRPIASARLGDRRAVRVCESVERAHSSQSDSARIVETLGSTSEPVRLDSQCKYAVVARGQADAYLRLPTKKAYVEKIWDHAAGSLIATEAGAVVSDITGAPLDFSLGARLESNRGVICTAADLHERVVEVIDRLGIGAPV
jgi:3'(2'), 5'-bisphosphate nucleotidase